MEGAVILSLHEAIMMQLDEMDLLETAYPEIAFEMPDPRSSLREAVEASTEANDTTSREELEQQLQASISSIPLISFRCPLSDGATLRVRLARRYPEIPLLATVEGTPQLSAATRAQIISAVHNEARRLSGEQRNEPHCLSVLSEAMLAASDPGRLEGEPGTGTSPCRSAEDNPLAGNKAIGGTTSSSSVGALDAEHVRYGRWEGGAGGKGERGYDEVEEGMGYRQRDVGGDGEAVPSPLEKLAKAVHLGRRLIYSHHIIAPQKRAGILKNARELELGGFSKVGWPGVIVVEGEESACEEFVKTLRTWRWKHLAVRGEESLQVAQGRSLDQERVLPLPLEELAETEGVSGLAQRCRAAGLADLFSTLLL